MVPSAVELADFRVRISVEKILMEMHLSRGPF